MNTKDLLDELNFVDNEKEVFNKIAGVLNEQYEADLEILEDEEVSKVLDRFTKGGISYYNVIDRVGVTKENLTHLICRHPCIIQDKRAHRLGTLALGFLIVLEEYLIQNLEEEEETNEDN